MVVLNMDTRHIKFGNGNEVWYDIDPKSTHRAETEEEYEQWIDRLGRFHRIGGSAILPSDHDALYWYIHGHCYEFNEYCKLVKPLMTDEDYLIMILTYGHQTH